MYFGLLNTFTHLTDQKKKKKITHLVSVLTMLYYHFASIGFLGMHLNCDGPFNSLEINKRAPLVFMAKWNTLPGGDIY